MIDAYERGESSVSLSDDTIGGALDRAARLHGDSLAVVSRHQGVRLTYRELLQRVDVVARALIALGVARGDRVGVSSPNCVEWLVTQYAVAKVGAVLVTLNPAYQQSELERVLAHAGVST